MVFQALSSSDKGQHLIPADVPVGVFQLSNALQCVTNSFPTLLHRKHFGVLDLR